MKSENKLAGLGLLTAISASLCCITPVLALLSGTSGLASTFTWLDPLRPYFIGLTVLVLGFAWYQKLKPQKQIDCNCDMAEKTSFIQTKKFLGIVTVFTGLMLAFPMYAQVFFPDKNGKTVIANDTDIKTTEFKIDGMTCTGCEEHVNHKLTGIINTIVSYEGGNAIVKFDHSQTDNEEIEKAITKTGYSVTVKKGIE
jgi:mercuric ion transport protein